PFIGDAQTVFIHACRLQVGIPGFMHCAPRSKRKVITFLNAPRTLYQQVLKNCNKLTKHGDFLVTDPINMSGSIHSPPDSIISNLSNHTFSMNCSEEKNVFLKTASSRVFFFSHSGTGISRSAHKPTRQFSSLSLK